MVLRRSSDMATFLRSDIVGLYVKNTKLAVEVKYSLYVIIPLDVRLKLLAQTLLDGTARWH